MSPDQRSSGLYLPRVSFSSSAEPTKRLTKPLSSARVQLGYEEQRQKHVLLYVRLCPRKPFVAARPSLCPPPYLLRVNVLDIICGCRRRTFTYPLCDCVIYILTMKKAPLFPRQATANAQSKKRKRGQGGAIPNQSRVFGCTRSS